MLPENGIETDSYLKKCYLQLFRHHKVRYTVIYPSCMVGPMMISKRKWVLDAA